MHAILSSGKENAHQHIYIVIHTSTVKEHTVKKIDFFYILSLYTEMLSFFLGVNQLEPINNNFIRNCTHNNILFRDTVKRRYI